jgi:hypothetical protein
MSAAIMMMCMCSVIGSVGLGVSFSMGVIPGTGPYMIKDAGLESLKEYVPIGGELMKKIYKDPPLSLEQMKPIEDAFLLEKVTELKDLCTDADKLSQFKKNNKTEEFLTLSGMKTSHEIIAEYFDDEEAVVKIASLTKAKDCQF